jgi:hypothetical protein
MRALYIPFGPARNGRPYRLSAIAAFWIKLKMDAHLKSILARAHLPPLMRMEKMRREEEEEALVVRDTYSSAAIPFCGSECEFSLLLRSALSQLSVCLRI